MLWLGIKIAINTAKAYGQGTGFAVGIFFLAPIFTMILGFGPAQYCGPATK